MTDGRSDKRPTIYDLAKLTNTSASTVGAVLNGSWKKRRISQKLADQIRKVAIEQGYSPNMQARALRTERSNIIGMIVPMYDNRYFGALAEAFEQRARDRGLFPIVTCTRRDPNLEIEAAQSMLAYRVDNIVCTGATDPDRIADLCAAHGVETLNVDLPGTRAPSIISDNYQAAVELTKDIISRLPSGCAGNDSDIVFIGGREEDHNTGERIRGFKDAHEEVGARIAEAYIRPCGYAAHKAERSLDEFVNKIGGLPKGIFINSTISLEGIVNWFQQNDITGLETVALGCFDWDPYAALLGNKTSMVRQNVPVMMDLLFEFLEEPGKRKAGVTQVLPEVIRRS
ncbi:substrate-binding domain-containing protein [Pseudovibrio sp. SPO723]|uniref:substrate-binding domain-containing protein n=1 Tax=Nesiotobacter zosterae TaxID=392721 RepID=UPI0029C52C1D|nr:substrate-binding domain-containing protein [Pseudovibrio sp. SPO723]MDX5591951.1 substrate-binding domain-containing protein [Pseudovibrio sp. SPO723]